MFAKDVFDHGPDPDNPGWNHWNLKDETLFNGAVMGRLITRVASPNISGSVSGKNSTPYWLLNA